MSDQSDKQETVHFERMNAELRRSIERCRALINDCRAFFFAHSNDDNPAERDLIEEDRDTRAG